MSAVGPRCFMFMLSDPVKLLFLLAHIALSNWVGVMMMCFGLCVFTCLLVIRYSLDVELNVALMNCLLKEVGICFAVNLVLRLKMIVLYFVVVFGLLFGRFR